MDIAVQVDFEYAAGYLYSEMGVYWSTVWESRVEFAGPTPIEDMTFQSSNHVNPLTATVGNLLKRHRFHLKKGL